MCLTQSIPLMSVYMYIRGEPHTLIHVHVCIYVYHNKSLWVCGLTAINLKLHVCMQVVDMCLYMHLL